METCVFCRIVAGELPASVVYEDDLVMAFMDIQPRPPTSPTLAGGSRRRCTARSVVQD